MPPTPTCVKEGVVVLRSTPLMLLLVLMACESQRLTGVAPCLAHDISIRRNAMGPPGLDLLLVLDTSAGMEAAKRRSRRGCLGWSKFFAAGCSRTANASGPSGVRIGVITSDMGAGGFESGTCSGFGDDALLQFASACGSEEPYADFHASFSSPAGRNEILAD